MFLKWASHISQHSAPWTLAALLVVLSSCSTALAGTMGAPLTIIPRHTIYITTHHAIANILPGGRNTPFTGIPVDSMLGADVADIVLEDIEIPALNHPVTVPIELILLNEKNAEPFEVDGESYEYFYKHNPDKRSLGKLTVVQTAPDDQGPGYEGLYMREMTIELLAVLVPLNGGPEQVVPASVFISSPVPIPFSFDPPQNVALKKGLVGDLSANWHTNKTPSQKNMFGTGILQIPLGGRPQFDSAGAHAMAGNKESHTLVADDSGDFCPNDEAKTSPGLTGCGTSDIDSNGDGLPDLYESSLIPGGTRGGRGVSLVYEASSGTLSVDVPAGVELIALNISSASGIFTGSPAEGINGPLDRDNDVNILKVGLGERFGSISFGSVTEPGHSEEFLLRDLTARALFADYDSFGGIGLNYRTE